jgi:hypothetical protein
MLLKTMIIILLILIEASLLEYELPKIVPEHVVPAVDAVPVSDSVTVEQAVSHEPVMVKPFVDVHV